MMLRRSDNEFEVFIYYISLTIGILLLIYALLEYGFWLWLMK